MWEYTNTNELFHYGRKGMKWGQNIFASNKNKKSNAKAPHHEDYDRAHKPKSVKSMSDDELRKRLNRLQMEKNYSDLDPGKIASGKKIVSRVIRAGATLASVTGTALTVYNNFDKINALIKK